jgi:excisionase family DNA binding protein
MSVVQERDDRTILAVDEAEIAEARDFSESLADIRQSTPSQLEIGPQGGRAVRVPEAVAGLIRAVLDGVSRGATVTIQAVPREVTTTTAAKMLDISRPTLMKLVADGKLSAHKVGTHTRLLTTDVTAFRAQLRDAQRRAFNELRELDEELGIEP